MQLWAVDSYETGQFKVIHLNTPTSLCLPRPQACPLKSIDDIIYAWSQQAPSPQVQIIDPRFGPKRYLGVVRILIWTSPEDYEGDDPVPRVCGGSCVWGAFGTMSVTTLWRSEVGR